MYVFHKGFHPVNFEFARVNVSGGVRVGAATYSISVEGSSDDIYRVCVDNPDIWPRDFVAVPLIAPRDLATEQQGTHTRLTLGAGGSLTLKDREGKVVVRSRPQEAFGVCGSRWVFQFEQTPDMRFFGMGEKSTPFEKSGRIHRFWNTDAFGDFYSRQIADDDYDPDYISVPYVIVKQGNTYVGVLIDNPFASAIGVDRAETGGTFWLGAENGPARIWILYGPTLAELTRKFQRLSGMAPLPPLWAFGYHQSRWGYQSRSDLHWLADQFEKYAFPVSGLWLDIEYMRGYRVFTFEPKNFPRPKRDLMSVTRRGYHVVPIVDPGVKREPGYAVYESGRRARVFCRNEAGGEFVGHVWPGNTVFPDFSLERTRHWWAGYMEEFVHTGVSGVWLDMNDPSTGDIECVGMLFENGQTKHEAYHNQYASLMAKASREGFLAARPNERPFIISRSGFTGSQRFCGNWTGDNCSNYRHLHRAIGRSLNLALSGMAFNAPDIGGFMGDTTAELLTDWMKACYLFPLCRNHTCTGTRRQEPWAFGPATLRVLRHFVRQRYKLIPYLYNLFVQHEQKGEAVLRPLFYDFADSAELNLGSIDDQFMVGPWIMQAPFVTEKDMERKVVLPPGLWFAMHTGEWEKGKRRITVKRDRSTTPVFVRDGALIPMQPGEPLNNKVELLTVDLLVALSGQNGVVGSAEYVADDGLTFDYQRGKRTSVEITAQREQGTIVIELKTMAQGYGRISMTPVTVSREKSLTVVVNGRAEKLKPVRSSIALAGKRIAVWKWE